MNASGVVERPSDNHEHHTVEVLWAASEIAVLAVLAHAVDMDRLQV